MSHRPKTALQHACVWRLPTFELPTAPTCQLLLNHNRGLHKPTGGETILIKHCRTDSQSLRTNSCFNFLVLTVHPTQDCRSTKKKAIPEKQSCAFKALLSIRGLLPREAIWISTNKQHNLTQLLYHHVHHVYNTIHHVHQGLCWWWRNVDTTTFSSTPFATSHCCEPV